MKTLLYTDTPSREHDWTSRLSAAGCEVKIVDSVESFDEDGEILIWVNPAADHSTAAAKHEFLRQLRYRLPQNIPILLAGPLAPASAKDWFDAGASDILSDELQTADLAVRLQSAMRWSRLLVVEAARAADQWESRMDLCRRVHAAMTFGLAHDYNNLLSAIQGNVDLSMMNPKVAGDFRYNLEQIGNATQRAACLTRRLLESCRSEGSVVPEVNLNEELRPLRALLNEAVGRPLEWSLDENIPPVRVRMGVLAESLAILLSRLGAAPAALDWPLQIATGSDSTASVFLEIRSQNPESARQLLQGPGGVLDHCAGILAGSGVVLSQPDSSIARIVLPAVDPKASGQEAAVLGCEKRESATVLLVEDEESVRTATHRMLRRDGYTVLEAASGQEGLELFRTVGGMLDAVILDLNLPGMEGGEVLHQMLNLRPEVRVVVWSGYPEDVARKKMNGFTDVAFIRKPAQLAEFPAMLRKILGRV